MSDLVVPVLVDFWQQECCGEPFAVGSRVGWRLVLRAGAWWPRVEVLVTVAPLAADAVAEWAALGNDAGPDPVVAASGSLAVVVRDRGAVADGVLRGGLQEDHHVDVPTTAPATCGLVRRIQLVTRTYRRVGDRRLEPIVGRETYTDLDAVDRMLPEAPTSQDLERDAGLTRHVVGLLVDVEPHRT